MWGIVPAVFVRQYFFVVPLAFVLNQVRTNVAHAYEGSGASMSLAEQVADSTTVDGGLLTAAFHPVGTRYHAMHHLAPQLPYHALGKAHRRLLARGAPPPYTATRFPHFASALLNLALRARQAARAHFGAA